MCGIYTNIQGLTNNFSQLEIIAYEEKPDFIILSETHLTEDIDEHEIQIQQYSQYVTYSNSKRTGGVMIYFKEKWNVNKIKEKVVDSKYWISVHIAKCNKIRFLVMAVYRSPSSHIAEFCESFEELIEEICEQNCDIIIAGDFNIDWNKNEFYKSKIQNILDDNGLKQVVNECTRITVNSMTIIDYVITNNPMISAKTNINNKISDHETINITFEIPKQNNDEKTYKEIEIFNCKQNVFNKELRTILQNNNTSGVNNEAKFLDESIENLIKKYTNKKTCKR